MGNKRAKDMGLLAKGRKASLMSQDDMAKKLGTTVQTISAWENNPKVMQLKDLASYYGALKAAGKPFVEQFIEEAII